MNVSKIFKAEQDGKLKEFLSKLTTVQLKNLMQQIKDDLDRYKIVSKNYSKEKYEKFAQPYIDRRLNMSHAILQQINQNNQND